MRATRFWFAVVSACWVALLYARALHGDFVYDDVLTIQQNRSLADWHSVGHYFRTAVPLNNDYRGYAGSIYRPLTWLGFIIERHVWGLWPAGFHLDNLLLHWLNGFLGFWLLRNTPLGLAAATSLIWLALPIDSEAVAWISGRHTLQTTFFILLALLCADSYAERRRWPQLVAFITASLCALLSNEWGILCFPLAALAVFTRKTAWRDLAITSLAPLVVYLFLRVRSGANLPLHALAILPVGLTVSKYLGWILLPLGMSAERSTNTPLNKLTVGTLSSLALLIAALAVLYYWRRKIPLVTAGVAWAAIALAPFCGIVFVYQGMAERYVYLASAGVVFALLAAAFAVPLQFRGLLIIVLMAWLGWGVYRLEARLKNWQTELALFHSSLEATPRSAILAFNLAVLEQQAGHQQQAVARYRQALANNPAYLPAMINLGNILRRERHFREAAELDRRATSLDPGNPDTWLSLGNSFLESGETEQARDAFQTALTLDPNRFEAMANLGAALESLNDLEQAKQMYERAISLRPADPGPYCNLGSVLFKEGDLLGATEQFDLAISQNPTYAPAYFDLGLIYEHSGNRTLAQQLYRKCLAIEPNYSAARQHLDKLR